MTTTKIKRANFMFSFFVYLILIFLISGLLNSLVHRNFMLAFEPSIFILLRITFVLYLAYTRTINVVKTKII